MEYWQKAKTFAEEAAKRTQSLTLTSPAKIADIVSETAKRSKEFAAEASKKADEIRTVALKQADERIKSLADQIPSPLSLLNSPPAPAPAPAPLNSEHSASKLEKFGVTDDLREFVRGLTSSTFQNFPVQDDLPMSEVPTVSNVRQDLTEWQQKHASLVLTTVQQISRLRYELCPRHMTDAKFWRIYFILVSTHVATYEKQYIEEIKLKEAEQVKDDKAKETLIDDDPHKPVATKQKSLTSTSSSAEQDLDTFLLGDLEGSDGPDAGDEAFDDDFDKIGNSDVEDEQKL